MFNLFILIVAIHFIEHLAQIYQLYNLAWARADCLGLLGLINPNLIKREWLHYGFAFYMLVGLYYIKINSKKSYWWNVAFNLQMFHYIEHLILISQALNGISMSNRISIGSFLMPRIELHFMYNLIVMIPILIAINERKLR